MAKTMETNQARAVLRYYRMSPTKARQVLDLIRGKSAVDAIRALSLVNREASEVVGKLLASAVANATVRYGLGADEVFVAQAFADEGPTIKRFRPRARGRATRIRKRSCHITIVVEEMPLEMRRVEAARSSGRQSARRAQRVASSRGGAQREVVSTTTQEVASGEAEETAAMLAIEQPSVVGTSGELVDDAVEAGNESQFGEVPQDTEPVLDTATTNEGSDDVAHQESVGDATTVDEGQENS